MTTRNRLEFCEPIRLRETYSFLVDTSDRDYSDGWLVTFSAKQCIESTDLLFSYDLDSDFVEARVAGDEDFFTVTTESGEELTAALRITIPQAEIENIINTLELKKFYVGLHVAQTAIEGTQEHLITSGQINVERAINE